MRKLLLLLVLNLSIAAMALNTLSQGFNRQSLSIEVAEIGGKQESFIRYENADYFGYIGEPSVPVKTLRVSVPYNAVNIRLTYSLTKYCDIRLTSPVHYNINDLGGETEYFKGAKFPLENAVIDNIGYVDGINKIVTVYLCPVSLDLDNNLLTFYSSVSANLTWDVDDNLTNVPIKPVASYGTDKYEKVYKLPNLVNPEEVETNKAPSAQKARPVRVPNLANYIIVCPRAFTDALERLAAYRRLKGYTTKVVAIEDILTDPKYTDGDMVSGINDDAGKLRAFLTDAFRNLETQYVLLAGKYPAIPIRYGHSIYSSFNRHNGVPSDLYFAELNSSWNTTNSGIYGKESDNLDYYSELAVGRIPFSNVSEINDFIDKLKIYEHNPGLGDPDYLSRAFVTRQDYGLMHGMSKPYFEEQWFIPLKEFYNGNNLREIISTNDYPLGQDVINELNSANYGFISFVGHGSPYGVAVNKKTNGNVYDVLGLENQYGSSEYEPNNGLNNLTNKNYPSWSYSISCETMPFDSSSNDNSGIYGYNVTKNFGESYVLGKDYGGVVYLGHTRESHCTDGEKLLKGAFETIKSMYEYHLGEDGPEFPVTAGDLMSKLRTTNGLYHDGRLTHNLLGDPITPIWISKPNLVTYINNNLIDSVLVDSAKTNYSLITKKIHSQYRSNVQLIDHELFTFHSINPINETIYVGINRLHTCEIPRSLPVILPLYLQNIRLSKKKYIVAGDVLCGNLVNREEQEGPVEISDSASITIESLGNVHLRRGVIMKPNSVLIIKADGDVRISDLVMLENSHLIVDANSIKSERVQKNTTATVSLTERNPGQRLFFACSNVESHKPMLVEGRTWWYTQKHRLYGWGDRSLIAENGISVGEEVEIDGMKWHKINVVSTAISRNSIWTYNKEPRTVAYMREDDGKIYTGYFDGVEDCEGISDYIREFTDFQYGTQLSYEYKNIGESFMVGNNNHYANVVVNDIKKIENSGFEYNLYECYSDGGFPSTFIEELGSTFRIFFFDPLTSGMFGSDMYEYPDLRYITDPDGTIIYEGIGGYKLWEATGVDNVIAEDDGSCRWYNLQGMEIDEPTSPGIYIRSSRNGNEKVAIR